MPLKRIFLAGEGTNELGSWAKEPVYRAAGWPGVIEALLEEVKSTGWKIACGITWTGIRKVIAGDHGKPEMKIILRACLLAKENKCAVVAFTRDSDGKKKRIEEVARGIAAAKEMFPSIGIIGGCAVPTIEGWILAFSGVQGTEEFSPQKAVELLGKKGVEEKNTRQMVEFVKKHDLVHLASDASHLIKWIESAKAIL